MRYNDHAMILLADSPVLAGLAKYRTAARCLDVRACKAIYRDGLSGIDPALMQASERQFVDDLGLAGTDEA